MNEFGRRYFPEISFGEALEIVQKIRDKNIKTFEALGSELGYSPKSHGGVFFYKRAALSKHYKLLEPSQSKVVLTRLGERIVDPLNQMDREAAIRQSIFGIPLMKNLYDGLGVSYHPDDFKPKLSELTGLSPSEISKYADWIESIYKDATTYLGRPIGVDERAGREQRAGEYVLRPSGPMRVPAEFPESSPSPSFTRPVRTFNLPDHYSATVPFDSGSIEELIAVLEGFKAYVEKKQGAPKTATPAESGSTGNTDSLSGS